MKSFLDIAIKEYDYITNYARSLNKMPITEYERGRLIRLWINFEETYRFILDKNAQIEMDQYMKSKDLQRKNNRPIF